MINNKNAIKLGAFIFIAKITYEILDGTASAILSIVSDKVADAKKDLEEERTEEDGED